MYLLLGEEDDLLCSSICGALMGKGYEARVIPDIFGRSARTVWRLDSEQSSTQLVFEDGTSLSEREILGVFVRRPSFAVRDGWTVEDATYLYAEKEAALLGWIENLNCPVINRYPAELWFEAPPSIRFWCKQLEMCGLQGAESEPKDTSGISDLPEGEEKSAQACSAAVIGSRVVWDRDAGFNHIDAALLKFAESIGLHCMECVVVGSPADPKVVSVETFPAFAGFSHLSQGEIAKGLAELMIDTSLLARPPRSVGR
jgi:hypothetical protein